MVYRAARYQRVRSESRTADIRCVSQRSGQTSNGSVWALKFRLKTHLEHLPRQKVLCFVSVLIRMKCGALKSVLE